MDLNKNLWLRTFKEDLLQNRYNLIKAGLYSGLVKEGVENLLKTLKRLWHIENKQKKRLEKHIFFSERIIIQYQVIPWISCYTPR